MASIGVPGIILICLVALLIFGPSKLPELGRAVGSTLNEFKKSKSTKDILQASEQDNIAFNSEQEESSKTTME